MTKTVKKAKAFDKMKQLAKQRGFAHRVDVGLKSSVSRYLNQELKRHIDIFMAKQQKVQTWYHSEKQRIRRAYR